jgi:hypothetical protein
MSIFSIVNPIHIHQIIHRDTIEVNQYSSTDSGIKCKKASHNRIPTEKAIKQTSIFFNFAIGYQMANIQMIEMMLTNNTARIQYK